MRTLPLFIVCFALSFAACTNKEKSYSDSVLLTRDETAAHYEEYIPQRPSVYKLEHIELNTGSAINKNKAAAELDAYFNSIKKEAETFSFNAQSEQKIICREGTLIDIPKNAFINKRTGALIEGEIKVTVTEFYDTKDIVFSKLSTYTTEGDILASGGMLYLEANAGGEECMLLPGKNMELKFPSKDISAPMQLFYGNESHGRIDWENAAMQVEDNIISEPMEVDIDFSYSAKNEFILFCELMPEFPGGQQMLVKWLSCNIKYPRISVEENIEGKVYVEFIVDTTGEIQDAKVVRGIGGGCDEEALNAIKKMPAWLPGKQLGKKVRVKMTMPVLFRLNDGSSYAMIEQTEAPEDFKNVTCGNMNNYIEKYRKDYYKNEKQYDSVVTVKRQVNELNYYVMNSAKMGWINCDRFVNSAQQRNDLYVSTDKTDATYITMIFKKINSCLSGQKTGGKHIFKNIPQNENVFLFAVRMQDGQLQYALEEHKIKENNLHLTDFKDVTQEELEIIVGELKSSI